MQFLRVNPLNSTQWFFNHSAKFQAEAEADAKIIFQIATASLHACSLYYNLTHRHYKISPGMFHGLFNMKVVCQREDTHLNHLYNNHVCDGRQVVTPELLQLVREAVKQQNKD